MGKTALVAGATGLIGKRRITYFDRPACAISQARRGETFFVTALGADPNSGIFYNQVKRQAEERTNR